MPNKTIRSNEFFKSLGKLEALAKGNAEQGDLEKAQLFHTGSNSEPGAWAGGEKKEIGDKWDDSIGPDGTDYKEARKAIAEKVMKGEPLTPAEITILKSAQEKALMKKGEGQEAEEEKEKKEGEGQEACGKAMAIKAAADSDKESSESKDKALPMSKALSNDNLQKGFEVSEFLSEFANAFGIGIDSVHKSLQEHVNSAVINAANGILGQLGEYLDARFSEQSKFNKSLAEAVVNIGHGVAGNIEQVAQVGQLPAGPPKSVSGVQALSKSFGPAGTPAGDNIAKSVILNEMFSMMEKGQLNSLEVVKYETTDQIRPDLRAQIVQRIQAAGNN
jgi:hypothetical protein